MSRHHIPSCVWLHVCNKLLLIERSTKTERRISSSTQAPRVVTGFTVVKFLKQRVSSENLAISFSFISSQTSTNCLHTPVCYQYSINTSACAFARPVGSAVRLLLLLLLLLLLISCLCSSMATLNCSSSNGATSAWYGEVESPTKVTRQARENSIFYASIL